MAPVPRPKHGCSWYIIHFTWKHMFLYPKHWPRMPPGKLEILKNTFVKKGCSVKRCMLSKFSSVKFAICRVMATAWTFVLLKLTPNSMLYFLKYSETLKLGLDKISNVTVKTLFVFQRSNFQFLKFLIKISVFNLREYSNILIGFLPFIVCGQFLYIIVAVVNGTSRPLDITPAPCMHVRGCCNVPAG